MNLKPAIVGLLLSLPFAALAADHRDGPLATNDPAADLNDVYLFINPNDASELILIGTVFPDAPDGARFSDAVDYLFHIDNGGPGGPDVISCKFGDGGQTFTCGGLGDTLSASGRVEQTVSNGDFRVYTGLRDDPFFFDAPQFNAIRLGQAPGFRNPGVNSFGTFNTLSIVMGIKHARLTDGGTRPVLKVWSSTDRQGDSGLSAGHSGMWYDAGNLGHGFLLQALAAGATGAGSPRQMVVYWNVFAPNGDQIAFYGLGDINGNSVAIPVVSATGGRFPPAVVQGPGFSETPFGTLTFTFNNCTQGTVRVETTRALFTPSQTINLTRLSNVENLPCSLFESGQIDRNGRPAINTALMGSVRDNPALKNAYNRASNPAMWDAMFRSEFEFSMTALDGLDGITGNGVTGLSIPALAGVLLDDRLIVDTRIPVCGQYLAVELGINQCGGRTLEADVIDVSLAGLVGPGVSDNVSDDSTYLADFPFMGGPQ